MLSQGGECYVDERGLFIAKHPIYLNRLLCCLGINGDWQNNDTEIFTLNKVGRYNGISPKFGAENWFFKTKDGNKNLYGSVSYISVGV